MPQRNLLNARIGTKKKNKCLALHHQLCSLFFLKYTQKQTAGSSCTQQTSGKLLGPRLPKPIYCFFFFFACCCSPGFYPALAHQRAAVEEQSCCFGTLLQHASLIFSSSPSPQVRQSQGVLEQPHLSSSHQSGPVMGGHRLLPSLRFGTLLPCQQLRSSRTCAGQPLPFTNVQLSPFPGAVTGVRGAALPHP